MKALSAACCVLLALMSSALCESREVRFAALDKRVVAIINRMAKGGAAEQKAFSDLEKLGCAAVPAIIAHMDDRRDLPDQRISLVNKSPDAFEGRRHYGPEKIVDALDAILNQLTGQSFGFIGNGATDEQRAKTVQGWREYLKTTPLEKLCSDG